MNSPILLENGDAPLERPSPSRDLGAVDAMFIRVGLAGDLCVAEFFFGMATDTLQPWNTVNGIDSQAEPVRDESDSSAYLLLW